MNIIEEAMKKNVLIEQNAVKKINSLDDKQKAFLLGKIIEQKPFIVNTEFLHKIFEQNNTKKKFSVQDFVLALNEYFEEAKKLFSVEPVSIKNCSENATIIGMVKKITEEKGAVKIELEDTTGSIDVLCKPEDASDIKEDDVIAATGFVKNGALKADKIFQAREETERLKQKFPLLFKK